MCCPEIFGSWQEDAPESHIYTHYRGQFMKSSFQALLLPVLMYSQIIMVRSKVPFWQLLNIGRNVLVISTCITCDITFPELLKVDLNIQYFDRMLLKRCQDIFGVLFWFSYAQKKLCISQDALKSRREKELLCESIEILRRLCLIKAQFVFRLRKKGPKKGVRYKQAIA